MSRIEELGAWPLRVSWVLLAMVAGPCLNDALAGRSGPVVWVVSGGLALLWTTGLVALLVPRSSSLTALRVVIPGGLAASIVAAWAGGPVDGSDLATVTVAAVATASALAPWVSEAWVDGSSYGTERRLPLRTPAMISAVVAPVTWLGVAVGVSVGPLLLATGQWITGTVAAVIGGLVAWAGIRSLHQLSRRWIVLVPTGMVVHDPLAMPEPQLFPRRTIRRLAPAETEGGAVDLTAGAPGLALELALHEPVDLLVRGPGRGTTTHSASAVLIAPNRPARLLDAATDRRIPVDRRA